MKLNRTARVILGLTSPQSTRDRRMKYSKDSIQSALINQPKAEARVLRELLLAEIESTQASTAAARGNARRRKREIVKKYNAQIEIDAKVIETERVYSDLILLPFRPDRR